MTTATQDHMTTVNIVLFDLDKEGYPSVKHEVVVSMSPESLVKVLAETEFCVTEQGSDMNPSVLINTFLESTHKTAIAFITNI